MKVFKIIGFGLLIVLLTSFPILNTIGQTEAESNYNLLLENQENSKLNSEYNSGVEVKVETVEGYIFEGQLARVGENSLMVGENEVEFSKIKLIDVKGKNKDGGRKTSGLVLLILGGITAVIGVVYVFIARARNRSGNDPWGCGAFAAVLLAVLLILLSLGLLIPGLILLLVVRVVLGDKYNIGDKWKVKSVEK